MSHIIVFEGRISRVTRDYYGVIIPVEVYENYREIIEKWAKEGVSIIVELKELAGRAQKRPQKK